MPKYELNININGLSKDEQKKEELKSINNSTKKEPTDKDTEKIKAGLESVGKAAVNKMIVGQAMNALTIYTSTIGTREDNIAKQNRVQNIMSTASEGVDIVSSLAVGGTALATGNYLVATMVAIDLASKAISTAMDISNNLREYENQQLKNTLEANRNYERYGDITTKRR